MLASGLMRLATLLLPLVALLVAFAAACGDGADATPTPVPTATAGASSGPFGPAPTLGGNVTAISPVHAARVAQAETRTVNDSLPKGLCFEASFKDLPDQALAFRVAFDDKEVTGDMTWTLPTKVNPEGGKSCYAPKDGFTVGRHTAAVSVRSSRSANAPLKQLVSWSFEVIP